LASAAGLKIASRRPALALRLEREVDDHDAVLLDDAINRMMPMIAITLVAAVGISARAPRPGRRRVDRIVIG
jgi:hypothetical protein